MLQGYYKFACGLSFLFLCLFGQETGDNTRGVIVGGFCCLFCGYRGTSLHKTTPAPKSYPSVRGDLINCFSTLLLLWRKKPFFYFWQCPIFSSSAHRVVHFPFVTYFVFVLFFIAIFIYFYVFIIWPVLEFCRAQNWDALRGGWGAFDRL